MRWHLLAVNMHIAIVGPLQLLCDIPLRFLQSLLPVRPMCA
jgi:hypothetical protein